MCSHVSIVVNLEKLHILTVPSIVAVVISLREIHMRKVLLATTALVALGGVSAATADVSVSGSGTWNYRSWSDKAATGDDTSTSTSTSFTISGATTADSGMEFGGSHTITDGGANGASLYISDDWGKITMGGASAGRAHNSFMKSTAASGGMGDITMANVHTTGRLGGAGGGNINYTSPAVNGVVVAASMKDAGGAAANVADESAWSVSYDTDVSGVALGVDYSSISVDAAAGAATTDMSVMGATASMGDITVMANSASEDTSDGAKKISTTDYGIKYAVNGDMTVEAGSLSSENKGTTSNGAKLTRTHIGVSYVPAAGLELEASSTSFDYTSAAGATKNDGSETRVSVKVTF